MAKITVTVPFPYSARVGGSGTSPRTITIDVPDNITFQQPVSTSTFTAPALTSQDKARQLKVAQERAAVTKLTQFGIPAAAASGFTYAPIGNAPPSLSEQAGFTTPAGTGNLLGEDITAAPGTVAGGVAGQGGLGSGIPTTSFGSTFADREGVSGGSLAGTIGRLFSDPRGTTTPAGGEEGFTNNSVIDPISIRRALANLQTNNFDPRAGLSGTVDPAAISNLAATTPSGIIPPFSDFDPAAISDLAALAGTGLSDAERDSDEADQFAAKERASQDRLRRQLADATDSSTTGAIGDPDLDSQEAALFAANDRIRLQKIRDALAAAAATTDTEVVLPTGVIEPLGPQSADMEAGIAAMLALDGSLTRKEALALWQNRLNGAAGKPGEDAGGGGVAFPLTPEQQAAKDAAAAKAAIDAGTSADANLTLAPDTLEFQRSQFLQGLRNRGLGDSGVAGRERRDAFNQANTRNIFENVFNRGVNEDRGQGLSAFVGDSNNALLGAGARDQAQNQFQQALDLSRGFNPAGTGFDTQGLTTLQQDILNPQGAGQAGLLNELAQQTARKKFGVGAEFLGRRNFADEFFGQDRGTSNTFAEHLNNRLFGGRF